MKQNSVNRKILQFWVIVAAAFVLLWRIAALRWPSSFVAIPDGLRLPFMLLGLLFLVCALLAWWIHPGRWTGVFLLYGLGGGVHWGGAIASDLARIELALFFVYLALTALGDAALLHLALIFPSGRYLSRLSKMALYAPAALALLLAPIAGFVTQSIIQGIAGLLLLLANLFSISAGVLFVTHLIQANTATRRAAHLPLIVGSMVLASVMALLGAGGVLPGHPEAWNLTLGMIPVALVFALTSSACKVLPE